MLVGLYLVLASMAVGGCASRPIEGLYPPRPQQERVSVAVFREAMYTGLVVRTSDLAERVADVHQRVPTRYVAVKWGDFRYYRDPDPGLGITTSAAFWPTRSTVRLERATRLVDGPGERSLRLELSQAGYERLLDHVAETLVVDADGELVPAPAKAVGGGFYGARGRYHLWRNCNHWTAQGLRAAGLPIAPGWAMLPGPLMRRVQELHPTASKS